MLLPLLIACGGDTTENTEELITTEATITEEGIEVVETTTNENSTTTTTTNNEGSHRVCGSLQKPLFYGVKMKEIADGNFTESIKEGITLVDFYANWCMPCLRMQSQIETFQQANPNVNVFKYDVDKGVNIWSDIQKQFQIRSIPFVVIYKNGKVATSAIGYKTADQLQEILDNI